jgi:hypothetical protein
MLEHDRIELEELASPEVGSAAEHAESAQVQTLKLAIAPLRGPEVVLGFAFYAASAGFEHNHPTPGASKFDRQCQAYGARSDDERLGALRTFIRDVPQINQHSNVPAQRR